MDTTKPLPFFLHRIIASEQRGEIHAFAIGENGGTGPRGSIVFVRGPEDGWRLLKRMELRERSAADVLSLIESELETLRERDIFEAQQEACVVLHELERRELEKRGLV